MVFSALNFTPKVLREYMRGLCSLSREHRKIFFEGPKLDDRQITHLICVRLKHLLFWEPFAIGPVQFSWPRGVAENWFTKPGFWEHFVSFSNEKQQNTEFTKFSSVRTPEIYYY